MTASEPARDCLVPRMARVRAVHRETHDVFTWHLDPPDGGAFPFLPGQFNMLYLHGQGEIPISISGSPAHPLELVHTIRAVGAVTRAMEGVAAGGVVGVRGPYGAPWPMEAARGKDVVIVAGGIGLAPLRPAIYHVLENRDRYGRLVILYGARTPADLVFEDELHAWRGRFDTQVDVIVDREDPAGTWRGKVGVVTALLERAEFDSVESVAFLCGPEIMMRFCVRSLEARGLAPESIHVTMERNIHCAVGFCGHCQFGPDFVCKDGPVFPYPRVAPLFTMREV